MTWLLQLVLFLVYNVVAFRVSRMHRSPLAPSLHMASSNPPTDNIVDGEGDRIFLDVDILGMIDFCLAKSDGPLTGRSRSKILNEYTNGVFKAITIGFEPFIQEVLERQTTKYRESVNQAICVLEENEVCTVFDEDVKSSMNYILRLEQLLTRGIKGNETPALSGIYETGYKKLVAGLKDSGCRFSDGRPVPTDYNICLSLLDVKRLRATSSSSASSASASASASVLSTDDPIDEIVTRTSELNRLSNVVTRTSLYSGDAEKRFIADRLEKMVPEFAMKWTNNNSDCQEVIFLKALILLLREGLSNAEAATNYMGGWQNSGPSDSSGGVEVLASNITGGVGSVELVPPSLRLYDAYRNAFERVIEICVTEVASESGQGARVNEDAFLNFISWEQSVRRNLTNNLWTMNPLELSGDWELVDVSGVGSLNTLMTINTKALIDNLSQGSSICFEKDGNVVVKNTKYGVGEKWFFKPGPAHLDTCEFYVASKEDPTFILKYVGFIDRGQRIESRFSKMPIRMTGRVVSMKDGDAKGSSRFVLVKKR